MTDTQASLPNLIIIGAQKCGTTSLYQYLDLHPEIAMGTVKEPEFFLRDVHDSSRLDWYKGLFDGTVPVRGEASTGYTSLPESEGTAERMHALLPDAKLIYLVRDPLKRIESGYVLYAAAGYEARSFREAIEDPNSQYVERSKYAKQLAPFRAVYPTSQILVETQEDLLRDRTGTLRRVFRFLEVDEDFVSPNFELEWERSAGKGALYGWAFRASVQMRRHGIRLPKILRWPAQRLLRSRLDLRKVEMPQLDGELAETVRQRLASDMEQFRRMTGLPLDEWSV